MKLSVTCCHAHTYCLTDGIAYPAANGGPTSQLCEKCLVQHSEMPVLNAATRQSDTADDTQHLGVVLGDCAVKLPTYTNVSTTHTREY